jgi:hypothetical protein
LSSSGTPPASTLKFISDIREFGRTPNRRRDDAARPVAPCHGAFAVDGERLLLPGEKGRVSPAPLLGSLSFLAVCIAYTAAAI